MPPSSSASRKRNVDFVEGNQSQISVPSSIAKCCSVVAELGHTLANSAVVRSPRSLVRASSSSLFDNGLSSICCSNRRGLTISECTQARIVPRTCARRETERRKTAPPGNHQGGLLGASEDLGPSSLGDATHEDDIAPSPLVASIEKRRGKFIAIMAVARKLAGILFALWRDGTCSLGFWAEFLRT